MWTQLGTTKTVVGTARGRVYVDSTWDNKDSRICGLNLGQQRQ